MFSCLLLSSIVLLVFREIVSIYHIYAHTEAQHVHRLYMHAPTKHLGSEDIHAHMHTLTNGLHCPVTNKTDNKSTEISVPNGGFELPLHKTVSIFSSGFLSPPF